MTDVFLLTKLISALLLLPGAIILCLAVIAYMLIQQKRKSGYTLAALTAGFYLLTTAFGSNLLLKPLEEQYPAKLVKPEAIVVLGGGALLRHDELYQLGMLSEASASRLLTALQLYQMYNVPIIVSGGAPTENSGNEAEISKGILLNAGIPAEKIIVENKARNTKENIEKLAAIVQEKQLKSIYLVTSAFHMPRSMLICQDNAKLQNIDVIPYPCNYQTSDHDKLNIFSFLPNQSALNSSYLALHEYLGLLAWKLKL